MPDRPVHYRTVQHTEMRCLVAQGGTQASAYRRTVCADWLRKRELSLDLRPSKNLKTGPHLAVVDFGDHVAAEAAVTLKL
jgi:hypothetical protein